MAFSHDRSSLHAQHDLQLIDNAYKHPHYKLIECACRHTTIGEGRLCCSLCGECQLRCT